MYDENQVKYNLIKKGIHIKLYYHNKEGFSEAADEHKCSVAGLSAL